MSSQKNGLQTRTWTSIGAIVAFAAAILCILAYMQHAGIAGEYIYRFFAYLFGVGYVLVPIGLILVGSTLLKPNDTSFGVLQMSSAVVALLAGLGLVEILAPETGGIVGKYIAMPVVLFVDIYAGAVLLSTLLFISLLVMCEAHIDFERLHNTEVAFPTLPHWLRFSVSEQTKVTETQTNTQEAVDVSGEVDSVDEATAHANNNNDTDELEVSGMPQDSTDNADEAKQDESAEMSDILNDTEVEEYNPPPLDLLDKHSGKPDVGDVKANANIIKRTLDNFNVDVEMDEISIGPTVTRYALKPAEGVRLNKITNLQDNLGLALAAHPVRIEAPIPGKALVGIEVPNNKKTTVGLGKLLRSSDFQQSKQPLSVPLGKGISGESYFTDINELPHLLIAGATGSGKSVTMHSMITSLLYRNSPQNLKMIMVDPKRVELTLYNGIPHLLTPVITKAKKSILALKWAGREMDRRYDILEENSVRDIRSYHENVLNPAVKQFEEGNIQEDELPDTMPYIVVFIDELADIMQAYPREFESAVVRLAQMSRAVGIHLVISTQRPSVDVITGLIKANVPARIALQVSSQHDSRTILDSNGAESLLGSGDMLYQSGDMSKPTRIQSAFISEAEVKSVAGHLKEQYQGSLDDHVDITDESEKKEAFEAQLEDIEEDEERDELYEDALKLVVNADKASTSYLQRKLRIGYSRAARIMDTLEENRVISEKDGTKARDVLVSKEEVARKYDHIQAPQQDDDTTQKDDEVSDDTDTNNTPPTA